MGKNLSFVRDSHVNRFTQVSNLAIRDKELSLKSRGLLMFMLSLNERWDCSDVGLSVATGEGINSIRTSIKELAARGYLVKTQMRDDNNKFTKTQWTVVETPVCVDSGDETPGVENPYAENHTQYNNQTYNIQENNTEDNTQSICLAEVRERLEYDRLVDDFKFRKNEIDGLMDIITDVLNSSKAKIYVGEMKPKSVVVGQFMKLDYYHIHEVLTKFLAVSTPIKNTHNYLLKMLYMQPMTSNFEMDNQVQSGYSDCDQVLE